jgi:serine/threonine protein kinase
MIHQDNFKTTKEENIALEKTVGFSITKDGTQKVDLMIVDTKYMEIWSKYLNRYLNQLGFHKLFKPVRKLGKGGFATVYEVERQTDGKHFAVKAFAKQNTTNSPDSTQAKGLLN